MILIYYLFRMDRFYTTTIEPIILSSIDEQIEYFRNLGILKRDMSCLFCQMIMDEVQCNRIKDKCVFKCYNKSCTKYKTTRSIRKNSFLENINMTLKDVLKIIWKFSQEMQCVDIINEIDCGKNSLNNLYSFFRKLCKNYYDDNPILLGGNGSVINCDETLFRHKPKYHRGRATSKEFWIFGMVDTTYVPARGFMTLVKNRSAKSLLPIIQEHVREGSIVYTDCWAAYNNTKSLGLQHETVNHSLHFVNPDTGVHTQFIESYWAKQKYRQKKMKGIDGILIEEYLATFMWWDHICQKRFHEVVNLIKLYY